jgi:phospholipid transport system substrate-binding protein
MRHLFSLLSVLRSAVLAFAVFFATSSAYAATPAETLIADNIHTGLEILNDSHLDKAARAQRFETFLLGITDMHRIANFTLGSYGASASQADRDAFAAAFQNYAVAVYQSYLAKYAGQTLSVTGSRQNAAGDDTVHTALVDPKAGGQPLAVDFRVRSDTGKPVVVDLGVEGIWLALEERDQFTAFLGQNGGSIPALISHLDALRANLVSGR